METVKMTYYGVEGALTPASDQSQAEEGTLGALLAFLVAPSTPCLRGTLSLFCGLEGKEVTERVPLRRLLAPLPKPLVVVVTVLRLLPVPFL